MEASEELVSGARKLSSQNKFYFNARLYINQNEYKKAVMSKTSVFQQATVLLSVGFITPCYCTTGTAF